MRAEAKLGTLTLGAGPVVVGTVTDRHFLQNFAGNNPRAFCDAVELRVDQLGIDSHWVEEGKRLERLGVPVLVTLRLKIEGGKWDKPDEDRVRFLKQAVDDFSAVDVELQSRIAPEIGAYALQHRKACVVSFHDFHQTPSRKELTDTIQRAQKIGSVVKIAAMANSDADVELLASLLNEEWETPLCVIAMGALGAESRVRFPETWLMPDLWLSRHGGCARPARGARVEATTRRLIEARLAGLRRFPEIGFRLVFPSRGIILNFMIRWHEVVRRCATGMLLILPIAPIELSAAPSPEVAQALRAISKRRVEQASAIKGSAAFHDFSFTNQVEQTGITFEHHAVEDAAKNWIPSHYDHGTAVAAADVNGDGKTDLLFINQMGGNELYLNLGHGHFSNITASAGIALADKICVGAAFADIDNDGDPDLFITTVRMGNFLFENLGNGKFKDISHEAGVDYAGHSSGAVFVDVNNDGLLDLFVANVGRYTSDEKGPGGFYRGLPDAFKGHTMPERSEASLLYINQGGHKFKLANDVLLHSGWSGDASFCDINQDGFQDLYVLSMQGDNAFYLNDHGKKFALATDRYFPKTPWGAMGIKFFDFNNDGLPDLYVTDMHSDMTDRQTAAGKLRNTLKFDKQKSDPWCTVEWTDAFLRGASNNIFGNALFINHGPDKATEEVSSEKGAETYWPWGPSIGDLNADGYQDAFITAGMGHPFEYRGNSLLLNENGQRFVDAEFVLGVEPRANNRVEKTYFTLDADGADKTHPYAKGQHGMVDVQGSLSSRSSLMLDIDDDGDLDIVTNEMNDHPQVLISNLAEKKSIHWIQIQLQGTTVNRDGLGAWVKVVADGKEYTQFNDGKSGYLAQSQIPLYFGLGEAKAIQRIEVRWPGGGTQTLTDNLAPGKIVRIVEAK